MATTATNGDATAAAAILAAGAGESSNGPIYVDTQHDDMVHDAQLDYYGCKLATASSDRTVKIYDVANNTYTNTATLQSHTGPVWSVSWSHPMFGSILASCSFDGSILIHRESRPREWTCIEGKQREMVLHESSVNDVAFAPHEFGLLVAGASSDGRVSVLTHQKDDSWTVEYIQDNALGVNSLSWAPYSAYEKIDESGNDAPVDGADQQQLQQQEPKPDMRLVTGGCDNRIRFWTKSTASTTWVEDAAQPISQSSAAHSDWVRDVAWAPSIIPNTNIVASCSEDRSVIIWTQEGGAGSEWQGKVLHTFDAPVWRVSWSFTGSVLAVSSGDSSVTLWKKDSSGEWLQVSSVEDSAPGSASNNVGQPS